MTQSALVVGGGGQIGRAVGACLLAAGWRVTSAQRDPATFPDDLRARGARVIGLDREDEAALGEAVSEGYDAVVDTVAFSEAHARQWIGLRRHVGALAVISTGSVYADGRGRTLDEARTGGFPDLPVPISEVQPRAAPGDAPYSTRKVALEDTLLRDFAGPLVILRAFAIHGPGSRAPREWWFLARALNGEAAIPLAYEGLSRFHTAATANIAELCKIALEAGGVQVLNAADPEAPSVAEIGRWLLDAAGSEARLEPFAGPPKRLVGYTPWTVERPLVADMSRAAALGYRPVTNYREAAAENCRWLIETARARGWKAAFPGLLAYPKGMFPDWPAG